MSENICVINAKSGIGTSSPQISQFTHNCDCIKFVIDKDFTDFALVLISSINGEVAVLSEGEYLSKSFNSETGQTTVLWYPSSQVTRESGCVIYQLAAYDAANNETIWYSKEGRLIVTDSIGTDDYSASAVGSGPNLVTQLLTLAKSLELNIENLSSIKVDKVEGKSLSQNDYSDEEKEKLHKVIEDASRMDKSIESISSDVSGNKQAIEELGIKNTRTDETLSEHKKDIQNCDSKIELLNENVFKLQEMAEENLGDTSYNPQSTKAQSGKAVAEAVAGIVNSAPETLNTLEELAKALGNDPNFATTIMTLIGSKVDKESGKSLSTNDFTDAYKKMLDETDDTIGLINGDISNIYFNELPLKLDKTQVINSYDEWKGGTNQVASVDFIDWLISDNINVHIDDVKVSAISADYAETDGTYFPTVNAVYDFVRPKPDTDIPTILAGNNQYNFGEVTELALTFPTVANDGDVIYLTFTSGETETALTIDTTNTCDIELIPEKNTGYEVFGKFNGEIWIVNYSEYTVSEG